MSTVTRRHYWKHTNVLVTGHEGFLASNLVRSLIRDGARVVGIDIASPRARSVLSPADRARFTALRGSVADRAVICGILRNYRIDIVFHLAAEAIVGDCHLAPERCLRHNVTGTWAVLEAARTASKTPLVIVASSDKAYGAHETLPYTEDYPLQGGHIYDVSKSCTDLIASTYAAEYGLPLAIVRCGNIYGPGDTHRSRIVPETVACVLSGRELVIRSDGLFTRDYIYIDDVLTGYRLIAEHMRKKRLYGQAFNFSNETPVTVRALAETIFDVAGFAPHYRIANTAAYEIKHQYLSAAKARRLLGWSPRVPLREGIARTIAWWSEQEASLSRARIKPLVLEKIKAHKTSFPRMRISEGVFLVPPSGSREELRLLTTWRNTHKESYPTRFCATVKSTTAWFRDLVTKRADRILFFIRSEQHGPLGHIGLSNFDFIRSRCELDNVVRGVPGVFAGIMTAAMDRLLRMVFEHYHLRTVILRVFADNTHAVGFYKRFGFSVERTIPLARREQQGKVSYHELSRHTARRPDKHFLLMSISRDTFYSRHERPFVPAAGIQHRTPVTIAIMANDLAGLEVCRFLRDEGERIVRLYVHRPSARKYAKEIIAAAGCPPRTVFTADRLTDRAHVKTLRKLAPDFIITVYWAHLLSPAVIACAAKDTVNFHPSLLPRNRGWYPHVYNILEGTPAGVSLHRITPKADAGPLWAQRQVAVMPGDTAYDLAARQRREIVALFKETWEGIRTGTIVPVPQDESRAVFRHRAHVNAYDRIKLDRQTTGRAVLNVLRARSFGDKGFAYYEEGNERVYLNLRTGRTNTFAAADERTKRS